MNGKPTVVSLFCGTGGSSLGYQNAGFHEVLAVDFDDHAAQCFQMNFPSTPFVKADITQLSGATILEKAGLKAGDLDCLDGSPPCQGFSTAGRRNVQDSRNDLLSHYVRLINEIDPKTFVMENVPGMVAGVMRGRWKTFWNSLPHDRYKIKAKILNAKFYGVPQSRRRVIVIGAKAFEPVFPERIGKVITVEEALKGIVPSEVIQLSEKFLNIWHSMKQGENGSRVCDDKNWSFIKLSRFKPSPTIVKTQRVSGYGCLTHWNEPRLLAINEALILTSFPETWKFDGEYEDRWARIGNSVPPKLMEAVAKNLLRQMNENSAQK